MKQKRFHSRRCIRPLRHSGVVDQLNEFSSCPQHIVEQCCMIWFVWFVVVLEDMPSFVPVTALGICGHYPGLFPSPLWFVCGVLISLSRSDEILYIYTNRALSLDILVWRIYGSKNWDLYACLMVWLVVISKPIHWYISIGQRSASFHLRNHTIEKN